MMMVVVVVAVMLMVVVVVVVVVVVGVGREHAGAKYIVPSTVEYAARWSSQQRHQIEEHNGKCC
jgi:hypothetical protein